MKRLSQSVVVLLLAFFAASPLFGIVLCAQSAPAKMPCCHGMSMASQHPAMTADADQTTKPCCAVRSQAKDSSDEALAPDSSSATPAVEGSSSLIAEVLPPAPNWTLPETQLAPSSPPVRALLCSFLI